MKRLVIFDDEMGIYLGSCIGLGFWSKLDPVGQTHAVTFESDESIAFVMSHWECGPPNNWRAVPVDVATGDYASIAECEAAGLPGWNPNWSQDAAT